MDHNRFADHVAIVTGAGSGIGAAVAHRLAVEGATVVAVGRTQEKLDRTVATAPEHSTVLARAADVTRPDQVAALVTSVVADLGHLDVLVNNAGAPSFGTVETVTPEAWRLALAVNLDTVYHLCRASIPHLRASHGAVVNVGATSALGGDYAMAAYDAAKGAVANLTRAMAADHAPDVRVNAVHPGFVLNTGITAGAAAHSPIVSAFAERIPFGRVAEPDEIAAVVAFLASGDAGYVTGVQVPVDGGLTATNGQPRLAA